MFKTQSPSQFVAADQIENHFKRTVAIGMVIYGFAVVGLYATSKKVGTVIGSRIFK